MMLNKWVGILTLLCASTSHALGNFKIHDVTAQWSGRVLADAAWYDSDSLLLLGGGTQIRSLRLAAEGQLCSFCEYKAEVDFARGDVSIRNALVSFNPAKNLEISIGHFKPPVSLETLTSGLHITFLERALPNVFVTSRRLGIAVDYLEHLYQKSFITLSLGGFGEGANENRLDVNEGYNLSGRITWGQHLSERCLWVIGSSLSYTRTDSRHLVRYWAQPESTVTSTRLIDTGNISFAKQALLWTGELALSFGPWSLQAEYFNNEVRREGPSLTFNGYYAYLSYFLTNDYRPFSDSFSKFSRVIPQASYGAIELALRFSDLDLNDKEILGGREQNLTFGLNWYLNSHMRVMLNAIKVKAQQRDYTAKPMVYTLRAQYDF